MNAKRTAGSPKHTSIKQIFSSRYNFYFLSNFILAIWPLFCSRFVFEIECWSQPFLFLVLSLNFFPSSHVFFSSVGFLESQEICGKCRQASKKLFNELVGTIFKRSMILGIFHIIVIVRAYIFSLSLHSNLLSICMPNRPKERKWTKASISHSNTLSILK